jgi:hypothetical protein
MNGQRSVIELSRRRCKRLCLVAIGGVGTAVSAMLIASVKDTIHVWMLGGVLLGWAILWTGRRAQSVVAQVYGALLMVVGAGEVVWWEWVEDRGSDDRVLQSLIVFCLIGSLVGMEAIGRISVAAPRPLQFHLRGLFFLTTLAGVAAALMRVGVGSGVVGCALALAALCIDRWPCTPLAWLSLLPFAVLGQIAIQLEMYNQWKTPAPLPLYSMTWEAAVPILISACQLPVAVAISHSRLP